MPGAFVTLDIDHGKVAAVGRELAGRDLLRRGNAIKNRAQQLAPVNKGVLRASITVGPVEEGAGGLTVRVGATASYALYVHEGTGLWGRGLIRPRSASVLRWPAGKGYSGSHGYVFSKFSKGSPPNHFLTDAIQAGAT
jgi:HK97 gp10 family phage protein